jgi:hypothetical protein
MIQSMGMSFILPDTARRTAVFQHLADRIHSAMKIGRPACADLPISDIRQ